jgi:hypothetical protein
MSSAKLAGFGGGILLLGLLAGFFWGPQLAKRWPWLGNLINNNPSGKDSPIKVVGGSITARSRQGWAQVSTTCGEKKISTTQSYYNPPCTYVSNGSVLLNQITVLDGDGNVGTSWQPASNWMIEIFDLNQNYSDGNGGHDTSGIKVCSLLQSNTCSMAGTISANAAPVYIQPETTSSGFYATPPPGTAGTGGPTGVRFIDTDTLKFGYCGTLNTFVVDPDLCERMQDIRISVGSPPSISSYTCPDGACRIEIGPLQ